MPDPKMTERQAKWFASVKAGLERDTGKTMAEWVAIARTCPETKHRARLAWFKENHGLMMNRASLVLDEAFGAEMGWSEPDKLKAALWTDPKAKAVMEAVDAAAKTLPDTLQTARKSYTAWSRKVQYAAVRPVKANGVMLGLAVPVDADPRLAPRGKSESWSERLTAQLQLADAKAVDANVKALLKIAWERS